MRATAGVNVLEGVGIAEAPRGVLIHHCRVDEQGAIQWANLIIATGLSNLAVSQSVKQVAERYLDGCQLTEGMLNRVQGVVRAFDPCLSCAMQALGLPPLEIRLLSPAGKVLYAVKA